MDDDTIIAHPPQLYNNETYRETKLSLGVTGPTTAAALTAYLRKHFSENAEISVESDGEPYHPDYSTEYYLVVAERL
jgi:hypothetical protein